jgi:hypothetical protein
MAKWLCWGVRLTFYVEVDCGVLAKLIFLGVGVLFVDC